MLESPLPNVHLMKEGIPVVVFKKLTGKGEQPESVLSINEATGIGKTRTVSVSVFTPQPLVAFSFIKYVVSNNWL